MLDAKNFVWFQRQVAPPKENGRCAYSKGFRHAAAKGSHVNTTTEPACLIIQADPFGGRRPLSGRPLSGVRPFSWSLLEWMMMLAFSLQRAYRTDGVAKPRRPSKSVRRVAHVLVFAGCPPPAGLDEPPAGVERPAL